MKKLVFIGCVLFLTREVYALPTPIPVSVTPSVMVSSVSANPGGPARITISTPVASGAYSTGYSNYLTHLHISAFYTGGIASNNTPAQCTSTNLTGTPTWTFGAPISTGTAQILDMSFDNPPTQVSSSSNTVISCPGTTNIQWTINANYFTAP